MKHFQVLPLLLFVLCFCSISTSQEVMKISFNGHEYTVPDMISESIRSSFLTHRASMEATLKQHVENGGGQSVHAWILPSISTQLIQKTNADISVGHMGSGEIIATIERATVHFDYEACRIEAELLIRLRVNLDVVVTDSSFQIQVSNAVWEGDVDASGHPRTPWYQFWNYATCYFAPMIAEYEFSSNFIQEVESIRQDIISFKETELSDLPVADAVQTFPIRFTFGSVPVDTVWQTYFDYYYGEYEVPWAIYGPFVGLDFMEGTATNPTQFVGIQPPAVANPSLDHIGFGNPYGQFQGLNESETSIINKMRELGTHSIRFHVPWRDVVGPLTYNSTLNPNNLTETEINNLANDNNKWASTDAIIDHALSNKMDVILQLAQGHTYKHERVIPAIQGFTIAPDSSLTGNSVDSVFYVNENFYLYQLKLFANAAVKRYANKVGIWTIEGELNAARLNHLAREWRFGNKWADESPGGFQDKVWGILRNAVRQRDPSAKLSTVFHMLNIVKGLQRFGPDVDIIGVNAYPNLRIAKPVLGMAVGELVWATRRALIGLGMGSKEVYVTETNYPGIEANDPPSGISIKEDMDYYSYNRQKQFMADAIESATNYGAKGFFWWMFVAKDVPDGNIDSETGFGGIVRPDLQFKQPASTEFNQKLLAKHPGKATVILTNKNAGGANLGGKISLYGQRDSVLSGGTVYATKDRSHTTKALQQSLGGLKHLRWENDATQFRLQQPFDILATDNTRDRYALFALTSPVQSIVKVGGISISSYVGLNDPWFVDANGNQPGNLNIVFQTGTNLNVFLGQSSALGNKTYKILANNQIDYNRVVYAFQNWTSISSTVSQTNSLESEVVFNSSGASVTANYVVLKPLPPANVSMVATAGQNVKFTWTEHPDPNVTQYHIWRYKKWESPMWVGTRNRGTTNWTDASLKVASGSGEIYFYDVKAYYAPNASLSDDNWIQVNGDGSGILVERPEDQTFELERIPESFDVSNYPNPFNPSTRISYQLPEAAHVVLEIYDITGRRIAGLLNGEMPAGYHAITWDGTGKASGVYLYRFTAQVEGNQDVFLRTGKLILTK